LIAVVKDGDGGAHGAWRRQMVSEKWNHQNLG
jgi:hypothetical protein